MADSMTNGAKGKADVLDEDFLTVPGQRYALVSFVSPDGRQKALNFGMKIRGVFQSKEEAEAHVKRIQGYDGTFDIFLLEMYKWCLIPPDVDKIEDIKYQESYLEQLVSNYQENQELAKQHFVERKRIVKEQGLVADPDPVEVAGEAGGVAFPDSDPHPTSSMAPQIDGRDEAGPSS